MPATPQKSESPDEFLRRNNLQGYDLGVTGEEKKVTIDKSRIAAIFQPRETGSECKDCPDK